MKKQVVRKIHEMKEGILNSDDILFNIPEGIMALKEFLEQFIHADERLQNGMVKESFTRLDSALLDAQILGNKPVNERQNNDIPPIKNKVKYAVSQFEMWCNEIAPGILRQLV